MELKSINISRNEYGENKGRFTAKCCIKGGSSYPADINIEIPDEMLNPIVAIMAQAVAKSMAGAAEQFAADVAGSLAPPIDHAQIEHAPDPIVADDHIPF